MTTPAIDPEKLEELLKYCLGFAQRMIETHGEFFPFGAVLVPAGTVTGVEAVGEERPNAEGVYERLERALRIRFQHDEIVAAALAANVGVTPEYQPEFPDGIRVRLECSGYSRLVYQPYRISNGEVKYGKFLLQDVEGRICVQGTGEDENALTKGD